jgi:MFS family permease
LFFVPLSTWWGRAPTIFWSALITLFLNLGVALAPDWNSYYALRVVQGIFSNAPPSIAIAFLRDIFFFHERARKIGFWTCLFIASPYFGPLFGNFMLAGLNAQWRPVLWLGFAMQAVFILTCVLFLDETWYKRDVPLERQPRRGKSFFDRMLRVTGVWQFKHHDQFFSLRHSVTRFVQAIMKPVLIIVYFN